MEIHRTTGGNLVKRDVEKLGAKKGPKRKPKKELEPLEDKKKKVKKYFIWDLKNRLIGEFSKEEAMEFFNLTWQTILKYLNKDKKVNNFYYIRNARGAE